MAIDFSPERWTRVRDTYERWWAGELDRPVIPVVLTGRDPGCDSWPEVYTKIAAAGKKIQIIDGGFEAIDTVAAQVGPTCGIQHIGIQAPLDQERTIRRQLSRYGIDWTWPFTTS